MTMPAGTYYVGDLCYVIEEWDDFCEIVIQEHSVLDGEFELTDGRRFATYGTAYGDGCYHDQFGNEYPVDAGLIGCILVSDISRKDYEDRVDGNLGHFHTFDNPFETYSENGNIVIGNIVVETDPQYEEEYDYDDYDEEYE